MWVCARIRYAEQVTSKDLAYSLDLEVHNARMRLLSYYRMELLNRRTIQGNKKVYGITQKGLERIEYLKNLLE